MEPIAVESMSRDELQALDLARLGDALADTGLAIAECGREAISATVALAVVQARYEREPGAFESRGEFRAQVFEARALVASVRLRTQSLKQLMSMLQTLVRSIP